MLERQVQTGGVLPIRWDYGRKRHGGPLAVDKMLDFIVKGRFILKSHSRAGALFESICSVFGNQHANADADDV